MNAKKSLSLADEETICRLMSQLDRNGALYQSIASALEIARRPWEVGGASVSIAGGLVHGEWEQVKAVQEMILENERLRREAREREEKERPNVTLKEQVEACYYASGLACGPHVQFLEAAGDTLRRLEEEGGKLLCGENERKLGCVGPSTLAYAHFLRSLGVEAQKP